jgi:hypothetical protein
MRASALLRAGLRRIGRVVICGFTARLKPCPDTCIVDGCDMAVQADVGTQVVSNPPFTKSTKDALTVL